MNEQHAPLDLNLELLQDDLPEKDRLWYSFISLRGVEYVCPKCSGTGVVCYGDTSMWGGGIGGQMLTNGVCDQCWGSGDAYEKWTDLRLMRQMHMEADSKIKEQANEIDGLRKELRELYADLSGVS